MTPDQPATFGELLRQYRTAAGLTQEELAERARISRRAVSDLERGARTKPWRETIALLAGALNLSADERHTLEAAVSRTHRTSLPALQPPIDPAAMDLTPLFGRKREEAAIMHLLQARGVRLVTLTGAGGVGKTRLALRVAATAGPDYPDGVRVVPVAPVRNPSQLPAAIATVLGVQEERGRGLIATLEQVLHRRHILLVLDNLEHLLPAAPVLARLLASCPLLTILATSRECLHLRGEQEFAVQPLEAPPPRAQELTPSDLSRYPATALFLARAHAVNPGISIDPAGATAVAEICRRLDGLPLAIELAAAQLKYESAPRLLAHLERRFDVLVGGPRDAPARQQTMRSCMAWSYDLLSGPEQDVLCRLGVFVGGCTLDAAEYVTSRDTVPPHDIIPALRALVDKSLLVAAPSPTDETRFTMLETIRAYILERLDERGEVDPAHAAFARYYLHLSEQAAGAAWGPDEAGYLRRLAVERDNLQAVLAWSLEHDVGLGLQIGGALIRFWNIDGRYAGIRDWIEQALALAPRTESPVRARALITAGWMALQEGDTDAALHRLGESLAIGRTLKNPLLICQAIPALGFAHLSRGDAPAAISLFQEGLDLAQAQGGTPLLGPMLYGLGLAFQAKGDLDRAHSLLAAAVTHFHAHGECVSIGSALRALGEIALAGGDFQEARAWFEDGLEVARRINHRDGIAIALEGTAAALAGLDNPILAARLWGAAEALHEDIHSVPDERRTPFARLPLLAPHLESISAHITRPHWQAAQTEGYAAPLEETLDLLGAFSSCSHPP